MHSLKQIKDGWALKTDKKCNRCDICGEILVGRFYWCRDFERCSCRECESKPERTCRSREIEHEHFNIIQVINDSG